MMSRNKRATLLPAMTVAPLAIALAALMSGCGDDSSNGTNQTASPQARTTTPQQQPRLRPSDLDLAPNVQFPADRIPDDEQAARAAASLANAIAAGDESALRELLDRPGAGVLDELISTGDWSGATSAIGVVRVCSLEFDGGALRIGLGVEDDRGAYLLGWEGRGARGQWRFSALPVASPPASRAADLDGAPLTESFSP